MTQRTSELIKACVAGVLTLVGGLLLLGIPGAIVLEGLAAIGLIRTVTDDAAWPAAILVTVASAVMVSVASLVIRYTAPSLVGWRHVLATALGALIATAVLTALVLR